MYFQRPYFLAPLQNLAEKGWRFRIQQACFSATVRKIKVKTLTILFLQESEASFCSRSFVRNPAFWQSMSLTSVWCFLNSRTNSLAHLSGAMTKATSLSRAVEWSAHLKQLIHSWRRVLLKLGIAVLKDLWEGSSLQHSLACCRRHLFPIRKFSQEKQQNINIKYGFPRSLPIFWWGSTCIGATIKKGIKQRPCVEQDFTKLV